MPQGGQWWWRRRPSHCAKSKNIEHAITHWLRLRVEGSDEGRSDTAPLEAVRSGWHRVRAAASARRERRIVVTWEGETLLLRSAVGP